MAARTCSKPVTQTARKGAHQGAAKRQARKMLRQVRDPIKNKISSLMACHVAPCRHLPHPYRMSTPGNGCRARTQYHGNGCPGLYSRQIGLTPQTDDWDCRPEPCARQTNPLLAILRFFPPVEGHAEPILPQTCGQAHSRPLALPCAPASCLYSQACRPCLPLCPWQDGQGSLLFRGRKASP